MSHSEIQFDNRVKRIVRRHSNMRHGVAHVMTRDGLIVARPRRRAPRFPLKGVLMLLAAGIFFKGLMYFSIGGVDYEARLSDLKNGSSVEQAGAWILQPDMATLMVANTLNTLLR